MTTPRELAKHKIANYQRVIDDARSRISELETFCDEIEKQAEWAKKWSKPGEQSVAS